MLLYVSFLSVVPQIALSSQSCTTEDQIEESTGGVTGMRSEGGTADEHRRWQQIRPQDSPSGNFRNPRPGCDPAGVTAEPPSVHPFRTFTSCPRSVHRGLAAGLDAWGRHCKFLEHPTYFARLTP